MKQISNEIIINYLLNKGFKPKYIGFDFWKDAIFLAYNDKKYIKNISQNLLPQLRVGYNIPISAIQSGLDRCLKDAQKEQTTANFLAQAVLDMEELCK